jgi:hypothetical protein
MPTVYVIYEKPTTGDNPFAHETRVYHNKNLAEAHVNENTDPLVERWIETREPEPDEPPDTARPPTLFKENT